MVLGTASVVGAATLVLGGVPAYAAAPHSTPASHQHDDSLRDLGAEYGLRIGTAVSPAGLQDPEYREIIAEEFSSVTAENEMKWETLEPVRGEYNWGPADELVEFAKENHQLVRGHVLLWQNQLPAWLTEGVADGTIGTEELREILRQHVYNVVSHFKGDIWHWDVVNEAFVDDWETGDFESGIHPERFWVQHLGPEILADVFRWAHDADPKAVLFYNDYAIEHMGQKSDALYAWVQEQLAAGVPIEGIGFQTHLSTEYGFPGGFQENMQRFADLGLDIALTEVDVRTFVDSPETQEPLTPALQQQQEDYWRQTIEACLAVRECVSYTVWGVSDEQSWVPGWFTGMGSALLWDENLERKPQYYVVQDVLETADAKHRTGRGAGRN
ncbi:endo-1,4-beta-xylanase [Naasia sp. SYSU D00948]|uniref:endo-1,4-beta-xylanase n=1 Tax=Naasia sp. SYSU D00948 TaxID=2817379 RepID=UPI001B3063D4|nr:endo-1,4-beta-xylanase [Naasia sp. SYSU D00948]